MDIDLEKLDGLVPTIVQDADNKTVLMLGYMNEEAYNKTKATGYVTFWSRTRKTIWMKGETSGNRLKVVELFTDCDNDTILASVHIEANGICCHTGAKSCFFNKI